MGALFSKPKPPKVQIPPEPKVDETPPPAPVPPLPPPAATTPSVQEAGGEVRRRERRRGRSQTILTSPLGTSNPPAPQKTLLGQ